MSDTLLTSENQNIDTFLSYDLEVSYTILSTLGAFSGLSCWSLSLLEHRCP